MDESEEEVDVAGQPQPPRAEDQVFGRGQAAFAVFRARLEAAVIGGFVIVAVTFIALVIYAFITRMYSSGLLALGILFWSLLAGGIAAAISFVFGAVRKFRRTRW